MRHKAPQRVWASWARVVVETVVVGLLSAAFARHMWRVAHGQGLGRDGATASAARCTSAASSAYAAACKPIAALAAPSSPAVLAAGAGAGMVPPHVPDLECASGAHLSPVLLVLVHGSAKTRCHSSNSQDVGAVGTTHAAGRAHRDTRAVVQVRLVIAPHARRASAIAEVAIVLLRNAHSCRVSI